MMVEIKVRQHERGERCDPEAARGKIDGSAEYERHEGRHVGEGGEVDRGDPPANTAPQHDQSCQSSSIKR